MFESTDKGAVGFAVSISRENGEDTNSDQHAVGDILPRPF